MNRLLTPLTNAIVDQEGTIDKYIGDAVMLRNSLRFSNLILLPSKEKSRRKPFTHCSGARKIPTTSTFRNCESYTLRCCTAIAAAIGTAC
jgi:hypothetical protein